MLNGSIRHLTNMMDNFTEEFMVRLKLEQLELEDSANDSSNFGDR